MESLLNVFNGCKNNTVRVHVFHFFNDLFLLFVQIHLETKIRQNGFNKHFFSKYIVNPLQVRYKYPIVSDYLLWRAILHYIRMVNILKFVSTFEGIRFQTHHYEVFHWFWDAFTPLRHPVVRSIYYQVDYLFVCLAFKWKFSLIKCVQNYSDVP